MESELFNWIRWGYKYLKAIYLSEFNKPNELINARYNKAFQSLAGIQIYQGNTKSRKSNDYFWKSAGFKDVARRRINWDEDHQSLGFILNFIKNMKVENIDKMYAELIAIKPGFHELDYGDQSFVLGIQDNKTPLFEQLRFLPLYLL